MASVSYFIKSRTLAQLQEIEKDCLVSLKQNRFITSVQAGGKSSTAQEVFPTSDLLDAVSRELLLRRGKLINRTIPRFR